MRAKPRARDEGADEGRQRSGPQLAEAGDRQDVESDERRPNANVYVQCPLLIARRLHMSSEAPKLSCERWWAAESQTSSRFDSAWLQKIGG
jgi:hypothetical protein